MSDLFRDTIFGQLLRLIYGKRILQYPEEKDPSTWQKYVNIEKSQNLMLTGDATTLLDDQRAAQQSCGSEKETPEQHQGVSGSNSEETQNVTPNPLSTSSSATELDRIPDSVNRKDPEKGYDRHVIDWYGPDDPDVQFPQLTSTSAPLRTNPSMLEPAELVIIKESFCDV